MNQRSSQARQSAPTTENVAGVAGTNARPSLFAAVFKGGLRSQLLVPTIGLLALTCLAFFVSVVLETKGVADERYAAITNQAASIQGKLDRFLFERYGDVQAFGLNEAVRRDLGGLGESERSAISRTINDYVAAYGCYPVSVVLDRSGRVVAINNQNEKGQSLPGARNVMGRDLSSDEGYQKAKAGQFTTGTEPGSLTGTFVGTPAKHAIVNEVCGNEAPAWTMTFTAPIKDHSGNVVGYWQNYFNGRYVEELAESEYVAFKAVDLTSTSIQIVDPHGLVLADVDPEEHGTAVSNREGELKDNLVQQGMPLAAKALASGSAPAGRASMFHTEKGSPAHDGVWARSTGALGYVGSGFTTIVAMHDSEMMDARNRMMWSGALIGLVAMLLGGFVMWRMANKLAVTVTGVQKGIESLASGDFTNELRAAGSDEIAQMTNAYNEARQNLTDVFKTDRIDWSLISQQQAEVADKAAQLAAISKAQAVIEFKMDGTIVHANENFCRTLGYMLDEIKGQHHRMFVEDQERNSDAYRQFWAALNRGENQIAEFRRIGKGGREVWIQASYNPIPGPDGRPVKVVKFATDITADVKKREEIKAMTENLQRTLQAISNNAQSLSGASEELSAVSQQMSSNSEETAAQSNVVAAASEQVSKNVETVATSAEEMSASVTEIAKNTNEAARVAAQAVRVAEETNQTVAKLGDSSIEIGQVIKVITSIAQQTNLLALNATIEAARAGEAGKGFAVVANEVKELAKQTASATEEIGQKIEAIQTDTQGAVKAIDQIGAIISQISDIQNTVASAVEEQTATTNEIARNASEAAKGSMEISRNIANVSEAARSTTEGAANTLNAAQELARLAAELMRVVEQANV